MSTTPIADRADEYSLKMMLGLMFRASSELTIASGAVTVTAGYHNIDTEADAASDDLDTINGGVDGMLLLVKPTSAARTVVLKHNTGNIFNPGGEDISLAEATDTAALFYNGSKWIVVAASTLTGLTLTPAEVVAALGSAATAVDFNKQALTGVHTVAVNNAADTFHSTLVSAATANRTATLPDATVTLASAGVATGTPSATAAITPVNPTAAFSGTGYAVAGQVITTTDNQTMTLNQCAGMLFVSASGDVCVVLSNTAVTGAPAVLTVAGKATTDAGDYSVFTGVSAVTTTHTHDQA